MVSEIITYYYFYFIQCEAPVRCSPYGFRKTLALPKRRESRSSERVEASVFVHPVFEGLKIICIGKEGGRERVPVPRSHRHKRIGE